MTLTGAIAVSPHSRIPRSIERRWGVLCAVAVLVVALAVSAGSASAAAPGVAWQVQSLSRPTNFQPSDSESPFTEDRYTVSVLNVGSVDSSGTVTVTDTLPAGVTTSSTPHGEGEGLNSQWECTAGAGNSVVACTSTVSVPTLTSAQAIEVPVSVASFGGGPWGPTWCRSRGVAPRNAVGQVSRRVRRRAARQGSAHRNHRSGSRTSVCRWWMPVVR